MVSWRGIRRIPVTKLLGTLCFALMTPSFSFILQPPRQYSNRDSVLHGLLEWRDQQLIHSESSLEDTKPLLLLPFHANEALVQGQYKEIVLKHGRFFDLFQDSIDDHESIIGMVLMGEDGMLNEMPLCEIHDFEVHAGFKGKITVDVTLRAVGRARINELTQMKPVMMGMCSELADDEEIVSHEAMVFANEIVDSIEHIVRDLSQGENYRHLQIAYEDGYHRALQVHHLSLGTAKTTETKFSGRYDKLKRPADDLVAASWAVFAAVSDKSSVVKALQLTNLIDRLQFGLKMILDDKYRLKSEEFIYGNVGQGGFD